MRGGFIHNRVLIDSIEAALRPLAAKVVREFPVVLGSGECGAIDLLIIMPGSRRVAIEVELTPDRVNIDIAKAVAAGADDLLLIVPNAKVCVAIKRRLNRLAGAVSPALKVRALTFPQARQFLASSFPFPSTLIVTENNLAGGNSAARSPEAIS